MNSTEIIEVIRRRLSEENINLRDFVEFQIDDSLISEFESIIGPWKTASEKRTESDEYQYVLLFVKHNVYLAFDASYSSWSGVDLSDSIPYEVVEATKTIKYWKAV